MSDNELIRFGCITCKRSKRTKEIQAVAQNTMEDVLEHTFNFIKGHAGPHGFAIPDSFHETIFKWARKEHLIPPELEANLEAPGLPTDDLQSPVPPKKAKTE